MWTFCIVILTTLCIPFSAGYFDNQTSSELNSFFISSFRNFWAFSIAWVIFALDFGSWTFFDKILSHKLWLPLGKLSFCLFMVHPVLQSSLMSSQKQPISFDRLQMVNEISIHFSAKIFNKNNFQINNVLGDLSLAFVIAIFLHLFVEEPFTQLGKLISRNWSEKIEIKKIEDFKITVP